LDLKHGHSIEARGKRVDERALRRAGRPEEQNVLPGKQRAEQTVNDLVTLKE
jgi:hypothetical protein